MNAFGRIISKIKEIVPESILVILNVENHENLTSPASAKHLKVLYSQDHALFAEFNANDTIVTETEIIIYAPAKAQCILVGDAFPMSYRIPAALVFW